jgi:trehalose-6-phosphatase
MIRFIRGKLQRWRAKQQREELVYYVDMLKGAEIEARAMVVAAATDFRNVMMQSPAFLKEQAAGSEVMFLHDAYRAAQKSGSPQIAAGIAVWIHTVRAEKELSNRHIAREMWSLLAASFDEVEDAAESLQMFMGGRPLDIGGYDRIPLGFA